MCPQVGAQPAKKALHKCVLRGQDPSENSEHEAVYKHAQYSHEAHGLRRRPHICARLQDSSHPL